MESYSAANMTTVLDTKIVPKVLAIIAKYGTNATFSIEAAGTTYDPVMGEVVAGGADTTSVKKVSPIDRNIQEYTADNETIAKAFGMILVAASGLGFVPLVNQKIVIGANTWKAVRVDPISSGDDVAVYQIFIRGFENDN